MKKPFFSILIPVYNVENDLPECLDSVASQSFCDYEVILLNDGSTDGSLAVCEARAAQDQRIRVISRENRGLFTTRLDELDAATGDYIVFLDSDDYVAPNLLEFLHGMIQKHGCDLVTYGRHIVDENKVITRVTANVFPDETAFTEKDRHIPLSRLQKDNALFSIWSKCVKRSLLLPLMSELRAYEGVNMSEDGIFTTWILTHFEKMVYTDAPLYYYRRNGSGMSSASKIAYFSDSMRYTEAAARALASVDFEGKDEVMALFWSRQLYGKLSLFKNYLKQGISKELYTEYYGRASAMRRACKKQAAKSYGFAYFVFKPCHYRLLKLVF